MARLVRLDVRDCGREVSVAVSIARDASEVLTEGGVWKVMTGGEKVGAGGEKEGLVNGLGERGRTGGGGGGLSTMVVVVVVIAVAVIVVAEAVVAEAVVTEAVVAGRAAALLVAASSLNKTFETFAPNPGGGSKFLELDLSGELAVATAKAGWKEEETAEGVVRVWIWGRMRRLVVEALAATEEGVEEGWRRLDTAAMVASVALRVVEEPEVVLEVVLEWGREGHSDDSRRDSRTKEGPLLLLFAPLTGPIVPRW
jgi:hypothetical protein